MRFQLVIVFLALALRPACVRAQLIGDDDESRFYAQSKQVNQFFRRFNGEEDEKGNRFNPGDKQYRSAKLRKKYLPILFDDSNRGLDKLKREFADAAIDKALILGLHDDDWFAAVRVRFQLNGAEFPAMLFLTLEKDHLGYKWVISKAYADKLDPAFARDTTRVGRFIHPMSHELDFMNLRKAFSNPDSVSQFAAKVFIPDHLSVLLYELKSGALKFKYVEEVKFHFFQAEGWYFELSNFNRTGYNTGWLISNIVKLNSKADKKIMEKYLYHD